MATNFEKSQLQLQAILAEYSYVSGLIPYYRSVEAGVLSMVSVLMAALIGFVATVNAQTKALDYSAQGAVLALSAWLVVLLVAIEVTALLRISRASNYLKDHVYPRLEVVTGDVTTGFESAKSLELIGNKKLIGTKAGLRSDWFRGRFVTSAPIVLGLGILSIILPVLGIGISFFGELSPITPIWMTIGLIGGIAGLLVGIAGFRLSGGVERAEIKKTTK
jgi:hypothetical protein